MKHVKWIFVVLVISSLTSFVSKETLSKGLNPGEMAPDLKLDVTPNGESITLNKQKGGYTLLSFWASYDAKSRMLNSALNTALSEMQTEDVKMLSISFDSYKSVFEETVRMDNLAAGLCAVETNGSASRLFKDYRLDKGFSNYLLNNDGVIVAKNISPAELPTLLN